MPKPYTLQELQRKYDDAYTRHLRWAQLAQDAYFYVIPQRDGFNEFFGYNDAGMNKTYKIYSSIPQTAAISRANRLVRMLMPSNQRWGTMTLNPEALAKANGQINITNQDVDNAVNQLYTYLNSSNLNQQIQDAMVDECVGVGALWLESPNESEPLVFEAIPGFCVMAEYYRGGMLKDRWYRFSVSSEYIMDAYPDVLKNDDRLRMTLEAQRGELQWIKRGMVWDYDQDSNRYRWRYVDILMGNQDSKGEYLLKSYFKDYVKLIMFRDRTRPGEVTGRGPAIEYMPEIKRLNTLTKNTDMADELRSFPPSEVDTSKITPEMLSNFAGSMVPPGTFGKSFEIPPAPEVQQKLIDLAERINNGFSVNPIGNLNQPVRTATEVSERLDAAQENTTIDVSRLLKECSSVVFESSFAILLEKGLIPKSSEFLKFKSMKIPKALLFSYINPLGEIEKNNDQLKVQRDLQITQQYFGSEGMLARYDLPSLLNFMAQNSGLPPSLYKDGQIAQQNILNAIKQTTQAQQQQQLPQPTTAAQAVNPLEPEGIAV